MTDEAISTNPPAEDTFQWKTREDGAKVLTPVVDAAPMVHSEDWTGRKPVVDHFPTAAEDNTMLTQVKATFNGFANAIVRASELSAKVDRLERTVDALQATQNELMAERMELRIKLREAEKVRVQAEEEANRLDAALAYERANHTMLRTEHDLLVKDHLALKDEAEHWHDDYDLAVLEKQDWLDKHGALQAKYENAMSDLAHDRGKWFEQEDALQRQIQTLTAERNMYRDKFDACKSHAAKIMALDQVKAEPVASGEAFH